MSETVKGSAATEPTPLQTATILELLAELRSRFQACVFIYLERNPAIDGSGGQGHGAMFHGGIMTAIGLCRVAEERYRRQALGLLSGEEE